jgi:hypothetical protein
MSDASPPPITARTGMLASVLVGALAAGCAPGPASPTPAPTPAPVPATPAAAPAPAPATGWRFAWSPIPGTFTVRVEADVESTAPAGGAPERERVESAAQVTLAVQPAGTSGTRTVSGRVDSLQLRASARVAGEAPLAATPAIGVRGTVAARGPARLDLTPGIEAGCATPAGAAALTALGLAREALPPVPPTLQVGTRWRDTLVTASCAGPIAVAVQSVASYEVLSPEGPLVRVRRQSTSTLGGQGHGAGQTVKVTGSGTADATFLLDPARGSLRRVTGEGRTTLTVTVGLTTRTFAQRTRLTVEGT